MNQCQSIETTDGVPCANPVRFTHDRCHLHGGHPHLVHQDAAHATATTIEPGTFNTDDLFEPLANPAADPYSHQLDLVDDLVPQANSIPRIAAVVDAIDEGCETAKEIAEAIGMSERQGAYYPNAARTLGLVEKTGHNPVTWGLTELGAEFVGLPPEKRTERLNDVVCGNPMVNTLLMEGPEVLTSSWGAELADSTIDRRLATINSWMDFAVETSPADQIADVESQMNMAKERTPGIVARRPPKVEKQYCTGCFTQLPSSGICGSCS